MSEMLAEIERIVDEDISSRVSQYDVLFEAITNSIHANATEIICNLTSLNQPLEEGGIPLSEKKLDTITIIDNGDGFNEINYNSFCKYRSGHKKELGGKGVGRFVFLKVYQVAEFTSQLFETQEERYFKFNLQFDTANDVLKQFENPENSTKVKLYGLTTQYYDEKRSIDKRISLNLHEIRQKVLHNLTPTLFFYKKKGVNIIITFKDTVTNEVVTISDADIPFFNEKEFVISDRDKREYSFKINYVINNDIGSLKAYYCANNRTVCEFLDKDFKLSLPNKYSGFIFLESDYLDSHVNNERNDFSIFPIRTDFVSPLSWENINSGLKIAVSEIIQNIIPETATINKEKLKELQDERPYLINYIDGEDIDMAGFLDKKYIIEKAKKKFDTAKEKILSSAGKEEYSDIELREAIEIAQNELVSYINDRAQVLERLRKLVDNKERVEEIIHNLFMERFSDDDYYSIGKNNLWLLDDRFTTYSYAASEKKISEILKEIGEGEESNDNPDDRPDLSIFFSHNPYNHERLKAVLIELKPFDYKSKSDRKKHAGIQQLVDYVKAFKNKERVEEVFAFLITEIDGKLADRLRNDDYVPLFSLETPMFHRFFKELGVSIYVISASTLVKDAEARNKVFLDIIRKQSRIAQILNS